MIKKVILLFLILINLTSFAGGDLLYQNFYRKDYNFGHVQNWQAIQDDRGVMYFANDNSVLEYDGVSWRKIALTENAKCRSLALSKKGIIYVGGKGELGFLKSDVHGQLQYESLLSLIKEEEKGAFEAIKSIYIIGSKVYFISDNLVFVFNEKTNKFINSIKAKQPYISGFVLNETLCLGDVSGKIYNENKNLDWLGSNVLRDYVENITELGGNSFLVSRYKSGIIKYNRNSLKNDTLFSIKEQGLNITSSTILLNNKVAVAIEGKGLFIIDFKGTILYHFSLENGLINDVINNIYQDRQGDIWLSTDNGISLLEYSSIVKKHSEIQGVEAIQIFNNNLFIATQTDLQYKEKNNEWNTSFKKIESMMRRSYNLTTIRIKDKEHLFASMDNGLYSVLDTTHSNKINSDYLWDVIYHKSYPNYLIEPTDYGVTLLKQENNKWIKKKKIPNIKTLIRFAVFENKNRIWFANPSGTLIKYDIQNGDLMKGRVTVIDSTMGKNKQDNLIPVSIGDSLLFYGDAGLFVFNNDKFKEVRWFQNQFYKHIHRVFEGQNNDLWIVHFNEQDQFRISHITFINHKAKFNYKAFELMTNDPINAILSTKEYTWFGGAEGLFQIANKDIENDNAKPFYALFRNIELNNDSLLFGGSYASNNKIINQPKSFAPTLSYSYNTIRFSAGCNFYTQSNRNKYSFYLEGSDKEWSKWSKSASVKYANLPAGKYTMRVKVKNVLDQTSNQATFSFSITPPWWKTYFAIAAYIVLFGFGIFQFSNYRLRHLKKRQMVLKRMVEKRTVEIQKQKEEIEGQHKLLANNHKEITDSINYAKGIQESILPSEEKLKRMFPKSFVLFRPKDIVSGDFYWAEEKNDWRYYTAVDCTGHGVPGAFVSMVGSNGLNRTVNVYNVLEPAKILDKLTELVENTFKKRKDGMDISLFRIHKNNEQLQWAGANNPLWVFRKETQPKLIVNGKAIEPNLVEQGVALYEIKANKQPIGSFEHRVPFTNNEANLLLGDKIYAFTDGFPDQFGGEKGKKFMSKKLKKLLAKMYSQPILGHGKELETVFVSWIEGHEQIDDVCIVGVEI